MKEKVLKNVNLDFILSLVFGAAVFVFFGQYYPYHLNYQEQFQLFLFTDSYFTDHVSHPGGIADYVGNFFTQFYFFTKIGALILAVMLVTLQRFIYFVSLKFGAHKQWLPFSFIPSLLYWSVLCDENALLGGLVSMLLLALFCYAYSFFKPGNKQSLAAYALLIVLYWLAGGVYVFFALFVIAIKFTENAKHGLFGLGRAIGVITIAIILPYVTRMFNLQFPLMKILMGTTYYRYPVNVPITILVIAALIVAIPFAARTISKLIKTKKLRMVVGLQLILLAIFGGSFVFKSLDFEKEEVMAYDFYVRMRKWDKIVALADKKAPTSPLAVACLNLALAQKGLLGEKMFSYNQAGIGGLLPDFNPNFDMPFIAGEIYYHLGLINTAQRFAFETMEAIPNYQKSVRSLKRLAETNIINGEYALAKKYLRLLQKTFYYKKWATKSLEIMNNEKAVNEHIEWGWLRKARIKKDFLFSEQDRVNMIGLVFMENKRNMIAFEYLLGTTLLNKDLQLFIRYYPLSASLKYKQIPKNFQEALLFVWDSNNKNNGKEIPYSIKPEVKTRLSNYKKIYGQTRDAKLVKQNFGDTYWSYYHFSN